MARPIKWRKIESIPTVSYFAPSSEGVDADIPKNTLLLEELEAIRLKDLEGLEQEECAQRMHISRPTFQRILIAAREKTADSLINGKAIHIVGGNYTLNNCPVRCLDCGESWTESYENSKVIRAGNAVCPGCGSERVTCEHNCQGGFGRRNCRRQNRR